MKLPEDCGSIADIREVIDALDREIVGLIGRRAQYVEAAARFKTGEESVRAPECQKKMLEECRRWAEEENLNSDVIEKVYKDLGPHFVNCEMDDWKRANQ
ncbi:MAG: chorismate mutase [Actinomycetota bacterium]|nr:chorismate mutase [Actinomycetota bacterium]